MNDAWVSHTNTTKYQHHSINYISNSLRVLLFDVFSPIKVWSLISTMAMVSSLVAWAEITAGTAWQSAWHGSQHGIDKHWHLKLRCRPSKRLGQQAKNDKMTSKLTQLCSSLFLNILYISLIIFIYTIYYSIRDVVQHSNYDHIWPLLTHPEGHKLHPQSPCQQNCRHQMALVLSTFRHSPRQVVPFHDERW